MTRAVNVMLSLFIFTLQASPASLLVTKSLPIQEQRVQWLSYYYFLHHVASLQAVADESLSKGGPDAFRHYFREKLNLSPSQELDLNQVAVEFTSQTNAINARIRVIRQAFWSKYPPGRTAFSDIPKPPVQFAQLERQKEQITAGAWAKLRGLLDRESFGRIDGFVALHVVPKIQAYSVVSRPGTRAGARP